MDRPKWQRGNLKNAGEFLGDGRLTIRSYKDEDKEGVQNICFNHFRSLCLAAVRYYIAEHFQDLTFLSLLGICFLSFNRLLVIMVLFNLYLFLKSRIEMEYYIRRDCQDLRDITKTYMTGNDQSTHFWVAQISSEHEGIPGLLVGCVGLVPSRENPSVAKLVRLVVDRTHRRMRIGSRLLLQLETYAREVGYESVRIYTNTLNPSHVKFVRQHGYTNVQSIRRGLMRGDLVTWHKRLERLPEIDLDRKDTAQFKDQSDEEEAYVNFKIRSAAQHVMD